jgi:hypothetical protein
VKHRPKIPLLHGQDLQRLGLVAAIEIITLPERISSGKCIQYSVDYAYFGLNDNATTFFLQKHSIIVVLKKA